VGTYNVHSFRAGVDAVGEVAAAEAPDILMVQECGPKSRLRRFADLLGMEAVSTHRAFNRVRNAVLFLPPWRAGPAEVRDLSRDGRSMRRGFVAVPLRSAGGRVTAISAHLGLGRRERDRHARELTDYLAGVNGPMIVGLDLNEGPEGDAARWIAERYYDVFVERGEDGGASFPAKMPTARIDYVFASDGLAIVDAWVPGGRLAAGASDHRPVIADLELLRRADTP
jgi:endonuclease/exonuclease/phosphatase family metal-dependent hydrolase